MFDRRRQPKSTMASALTWWSMICPTCEHCRSGRRVCCPRSDRDARHAFESAGAFLRGHFIYTSGRHGADYLEKFRILEDPRATTELASMIADRFRSIKPELVAGPTTGGIILAFEVARQLGVDAVYVERGESGGRVLRRGFEILPDTRVLVVDDVVTTGGSLVETQACIVKAGGVVIGIGLFARPTDGPGATVPPLLP